MKQFLTEENVLRVLVKGRSPRSSGLRACAKPTSAKPTSAKTTSAKATVSKSVLSRPSTCPTRLQKTTAPTRHAGRQEEHLLDAEGLRTRRLWQNWGSQTAEQLLQSVPHIESDNDPEPLYSGRCGNQPKYRLTSDAESDITALSLLTCSEKDDEILKGRRKRRRPKFKEDTQPVEKTDWVNMSRGRKTALDLLMQRDASELQSLMKPGRSCISRRNRGGLSRLEKALLRQCTFTKGLACIKKSSSTENIISYLGKVDRAPSSCSLESDYDTPPSPSPRCIASSIQNYVRSKSADARINCTKTVNLKSVLPAGGKIRRFARRRTQHCPSVAKQSARLASSHEQDSTFTKKVQKKIEVTMSALDRITGYGDRRDVIADVGERLVYTAEDYARFPRYPQNIRISPQLSQIIKRDVQRRMGRPRNHELRQQDIVNLNQDQPSLGRSHRNLLIFNWLNNLVGDEFYLQSEPDIYGMDDALEKA